jgi:hypothetical protein
MVLEIEVPQPLVAVAIELFVFAAEQSIRRR